MTQSSGKVRVILSHNQPIDGQERKAGEIVEVDPRFARLLKSRGGAQIESEQRLSAAAEDPDAATVADLRALAEQRGVDLPSGARKADIQAALGATEKTPETQVASSAASKPAEPAEKGGKR